MTVGGQLTFFFFFFFYSIFVIHMRLLGFQSPVFRIGQAWLYRLCYTITVDKTVNKRVRREGDHEHQDLILEKSHVQHIVSLKLVIRMVIKIIKSTPVSYFHL